MMKDTLLIDSEQRNQATDPHLSFIVQAPAGSGKTEILSQRYLRLLSTVSAPEQIVALTFTRKAACEMRARILSALQDAADGKKAKSSHQQMRLDFARQALDYNAHYQWGLLEQPNRLKIITIDSLCQQINQAIPLMEQQITYAKITDNPEVHYLTAGRRCIQFALINPEYQKAIKTLLLHVDNRQDQLLDLFKALLSQRDQWLGVLFQARSQEKSQFEQALYLMEQHELKRFTQSLPTDLAAKLTDCARELASKENQAGSSRAVLKDWYDFKKTNQEIAAALSNLLLTGTDQFRKSFDHHVGLLKTSFTPSDYKHLKNTSKDLLAALQEYPEFLEALIQVRHLPKPEYHPEQWEVLQALFLLLPLLVAHLQILFSEQNEVDFTNTSQQALTALGNEENPTDLALYLDYKLQHLLVDEFQDTSITQFELLSKLTLGWQEADGKTLFIVGDPMQSIYRFRQAEVGLFFRAKEQGIGPVKLHFLQLSCNFRATARIIDWVNYQFSKIFPKQVDIESGAVSFHPSVNVIEEEQDSTIHALEFKNREQEARKLIQIIQQELETHPKQSIAILVRSRTQLSEIIRLLRQEQIPYQGTDITLLAHLMHLRDVWSLTQALLFPANRLAWLALLHSPYCGLSLQDIHAIACFNKKKSIYSALLQLDKIQDLSEEGRIRATFFIGVMHQSLTKRHTTRLSAWIISTLKALQVNKILNAKQLNDLEQFWTLLDRYEQEGRLANKQEFLAALNKLYSQQANPSRLQIMTIHKSKGLEFDTVILPGLGSPSNPGDQPMLRWLSLPTKKQGTLLLMSPIKAAYQEESALYDYLAQLDKVKSHYEAQRLLYVAVTRAKSRLYLTDHSEKSSKSSLRMFLKQQKFSQDETANYSMDSSYALAKLVRLPLNYYLITEEGILDSTPKAKNFIFSSSIPRLIGIITHQLLQWICDKHPITAEQIPWSLAYHELRKLGFNESIRQKALAGIQASLRRLFADPIGSWIIARHHQEQNEYTLLVEQQGKLLTRIIDRTFEDQGKRWIIDFKTGKQEDSSEEKHQEQLNEYGSYLSAKTELPIHCGIYYLSTNHWVNWHYVLD